MRRRNIVLQIWLWLGIGLAVVAAAFWAILKNNKPKSVSMKRNTLSEDDRRFLELISNIGEIYNKIDY